ncbi:MAG: UDP-N-acetylglucosamine 2-epimerase [Candidatus Blackburnbacteria bacterium RIFCSPLOWO2_01_FULL_41_27]|uniref:UDP-N-acetylglucosamine 2-epimerase n=1 Tax=Candidatus Blackburnbacteria bacterium RIFCSPLOWO2_01_FULL_41_27 TaxID=1797520 RepID=A0A1G1VI57_9BACT|nr:MAG: UDP-N-acetylglucosamine 2-epimerase [Candidatus Blackburnbacteria bacterium RIFCSPLOWO2_01_FULL_41_27]
MSKPKNLKIMTVMGTRPEIIRLSCILPKMDEYFDHIIVFTSQSYDKELSTVFFEDFKLRKPDYVLSVKADTLGGQLANILTQTEEVMLKEKPDGLLVLGDTNSALCTIIAKRLKIPIFHMEAGNRSFDDNVPEEINRRIIDHISDFNLPYGEHSRRYLIREGVHPGSIYTTGSPLNEVLTKFKPDIEASGILKELKLKEREYFVVSTHREENVDNPDNLRELFASINSITEEYGFPAIVTLHPRTKVRLEAADIQVGSKVVLHEPFGFLDYNKLQMNALCVLSDSGTIQEESTILQFRAVQIRVSSERPEAFDTGSIILTGFNRDSIASAVAMTVDEEKKGVELVVPDTYKATNVSSQVVKLIMGLASIRKNHNKQRYN